MASDADKPQVASVKKHAADTRYQIFLPMLLGVLLVVGGLITALLLPRQLQVQTVKDLMVTVFVLCPLVLCMFPVYILMVALAYGVSMLHDPSAKGLRQLNGWMEGAAKRVHGVTAQVASRTIDARARFAYLEKLLSAFDEETVKDSGNEEGSLKNGS